MLRKHGGFALDDAKVAAAGSVSTPPLLIRLVTKCISASVKQQIPGIKVLACGHLGTGQTDESREVCSEDESREVCSEDESREVCSEDERRTVKSSNLPWCGTHVVKCLEHNMVMTEIAPAFFFTILFLFVYQNFSFLKCNIQLR